MLNARSMPPAMIHATGAIRCGLMTLALALASLRPAWAQESGSAASNDAPRFLSSYNFHLEALALADEDPRFSWNARLGGDLDVVDIGRARVNLLADYEIVLGDELQPFDPIQGNYTLEASAWLRTYDTDIGAVFHHVSRHLGDRPKTFGIAWNVVGARVSRRFSRDALTIDMRGGAGWVTHRAYVDYAWTGTAGVAVIRMVQGRTGVFARAAGELMGVEEGQPDRGLQKGGRVEVGLRLHGDGAVLELFGGYERRIDAFLLERTAREWPFAGFRITSR
jgi:hypothetical protein